MTARRLLRRRPVWSTWWRLGLFAAGVAVDAVIGTPADAASLGLLGLIVTAAPALRRPPQHAAVAVDLVDVGEPVDVELDAGTLRLDTSRRGVYEAIPTAWLCDWPLGVTWRTQVTVRLDRPLAVAPLPVPPAPGAVGDAGDQLRAWQPGDTPRRLARGATARRAELVVRDADSGGTGEPERVEARLEVDEEAGKVLGEVLERLAAGPVRVAVLQGGQVVESTVTDRDGARRALAAAEVGVWP